MAWIWPEKGRLAAAVAAIALAACAHTRAVYLSPEMDPAALRRVDRDARDRTTQVELRDGRLFLADGLRLQPDTTSWHSPAAGTPWTVPTLQIYRIRIESHWQGVRDGLLIGAIVGLPSGALIIDTGSRLGAALAGGLDLGVWGAGIGAIAGGSTTYVLVPEQNPQPARPRRRKCARHGHAT